MPNEHALLPGTKSKGLGTSAAAAARMKLPLVCVMERAFAKCRENREKESVSSWRMSLHDRGGIRVGSCNREQRKG